MTERQSLPQIASALPLAEDLVGQSDYETSLLRSYLEQARQCLLDFAWCTELREQRFGVGIGGVIAVFLVEAVVKGRDREWLWVIAGDLPVVYFAHGRAPDPCAALREYCDILESWVRAVDTATLGRDIFPLRAEPTRQVAQVIAAKVTTMRRIVLPALCPPGG
jgi:hypothetical protein